MNFSRPSRFDQVAVWFGVVGAPLAFVGFQFVGVGSADGGCSPAGMRWGIDPNLWSLALMAACGAVAVAAIATAVLVWVRTRVEEDAPPPLGRIHFLATIGIVVGILFLFIILMAGLGSTVVEECVQS